MQSAKTVFLVTGGFFLALFLASCGGFAGKEDASYDLGYLHPISVDPQIVTFDIDVSSEKTALTEADRAAIRSIVKSYKSRGHGAISISAPSGSPNERNALGLVPEIDALVQAEGVPGLSRKHGIYRASSANTRAPVIISYRRYVATPTPCGNWSKNYAVNSANRPYPNFGCATQNNLARLVSEPADLAKPREQDPAYADRRTTVIDKYGKGEQTGAAIAENASGNVSNIGN